MGISMTVDGSPASCRASARALRELALAVHQAGNGLANVRSVALGAWRGLAADLLDFKVKRMVDAADTLTPGVRTLADALDAHADELAAVKAEMRRARSTATAAGIPVSEDTYPSFGEVELTPAQEGPRDHGELIIERAREAEQRAQRAISSAAEAARGLSWLPEPTSAGSAAKAKGPLDFLPSLPDLSGLPDLSDLAPHIPGLPMPLPEVDLDAPDLRTLGELFPLLVKKAPDVGKEVAGEAGKLGKDLGKKALGPLTAGFDQWVRDLPNEDLDLGDRLMRVGTRAGLNLGGAAAGTAVCAALVVPTVVAPACGMVGAHLGNKGADEILEHFDGR